ncbi:hypothetical protein ACA910_002094 [Epithemia clementina (nom. ined.)]
MLSLSSRCIQWRIHLGVFPANTTQDELMTLLQQECLHYQQLLEQHPFPVPPEEQQQQQQQQAKNGEGTSMETATNNAAASVDSLLDPLTALMMEEQSKQERLQELELQYRKERARRNRTGVATSRTIESEEYDETAVTLQIIDKDLQRLPSPSVSSVLENDNDDAKNKNKHNARTQRRKLLLRQVLFVYHCVTHPTPGYRQGMHEIASYLLHALELDQSSSSSSSSSSSFQKEPHIDDDNNNNNDQIFSAAAAAHTYALLNAVLDPLQPAFDVSMVRMMEHSGSSSNNINNNNNGGTNNTSGTTGTTTTVITEKQPLVALGRRILQWTGRYHPNLLNCLQQQVQVPPQLYLTKWIRLLYSREVQHPQSNVLPLWDVWLESCVCCARSSSTTTTQSTTTQLLTFLPSSPTSSGRSNHGNTTTTTTTTTTTLLQVLEAAAVARLLLHAPHILSCEDPLHFLMNVPPESVESLTAWQTVTQELLQGQATLSHVVLTTPLPQSPPPLSQPAPLTSGNSTGSSLLWNNPLSALTASTSLTTDALEQQQQQATFSPSSSSQFQHQDHGQNPLFSSLSVGLKQTLEKAKTKTQSISKRFYQEWEQAQQHQQQPHQHSESHYLQQPHQPDHSSSSYNVFYREASSEPAFYDPTVGVVFPPTTNTTHLEPRLDPNKEDSPAVVLTTNLTVIQSYLTHLEHEKGIAVPSTVWQAMADLKQYAVGGPMATS